MFINSITTRGIYEFHVKRTPLVRCVAGSDPTLAVFQGGAGCPFSVPPWNVRVEDASAPDSLDRHAL